MNRPITKGDQVQYFTGMATVLDILPYTGIYSQWFNVVLVLSSTRTRSGRVEMAYNDLALRDGAQPAPMNSTQPTNNKGQPHIRAVPMALFPTLGTLQEVMDLADSKLPIMNKNELNSLMFVYHNTLLKVINDQQ